MSNVTLPEIVETVALATGVRLLLLTGKVAAQRHQVAQLLLARKIVAFLADRHTEVDAFEIATALGISRDMAAFLRRTGRLKKFYFANEVTIELVEKRIDAIHDSRQQATEKERV